MRLHRGIVLLLALSVISACGVRPRAVVKQDPSSQRPRTTQAGQPGATGQHVVVRGDTLYAIAFRNGLDYRDLARWNSISAPYTIYPGQRLRLASSAPVAAAPPRSTTRPATPAPATRPAPSATGSTIAQQPPAPVSPASTTQAPVAVPATTPVSGPATTPIVATGSSRTVHGITWRWPTSGQLISRFVVGEPTKQGIGVAGNAGQPIVAAADGEVVYSGSGLIGYGELVIIRHSDTFLSAYGHNRKRLVDEGQRVRAGQQIAEMGRSGASRDMLHFEVRQNGKPVDPMGFIPAR